MKDLIIVTSSFPIYNDEPFLEKEYKYLKKKFNRIHFVVVTNNQQDLGERNPIDEFNVVEVKMGSSNKLAVLFTALLNTKMWREIVYILSKIGLRQFFSCFKIAAVSLNNAKIIRTTIENKLLPSISSNAVLYSYWCDEAAMAVSMLVGHPKVSKAVTRVHGWDLYFDRHTPAYLPFRSFIQKRCEAIFSISEKGKSVIETAWKVPTANVFVAKLGVEKQPFNRKSGEDVFTIVSCSNIIPLKRVELIAESIVALEIPVKWVHFGSGSGFENVNEIVENGKKDYQNIQLMGQVSNQEVLDFYANNHVDLFINASTTEGIPFSIMESMSFGIPVLATDVGGTHEIVNNENGCLLSENPSSKEIAEQITRFSLMSVDDFENYSEKAHEMWENTYSAEKNFTKFAEKLTN